MLVKEAKKKFCPLIKSICKTDYCMAWQYTKIKDLFVLDYKINSACACGEAVNSDNMCWKCGTTPTEARGGYSKSETLGSGKDLEEDEKEGYCRYFGDIKSDNIEIGDLQEEENNQ